MMQQPEMSLKEQMLRLSWVSSDLQKITHFFDSTQLLTNYRWNRFEMWASVDTVCHKVWFFFQNWTNDAFFSCMNGVHGEQEEPKGGIYCLLILQHAHRCHHRQCDVCLPTIIILWSPCLLAARTAVLQQNERLLRYCYCQCRCSSLGRGSTDVSFCIEL